MNFLAHLYLSGESDDKRIGNFIGDFVKGKKYREYPAPIREGIILHRKIDAYTDSHATSQRLRPELSPHFGHYSGVVLDLYWDHFLAANWGRFHTTDLPEYTLSVYKMLRSNWEVLPAGVKRMLPYMERDNWLNAYATTEGIGRALTGLSRRTRFESNMQQGQAVLQENYELFKAGFFEFMSDIQTYVATKNPDFSVT